MSFPTDSKLLYDSLRKAMSKTASLSSKFNLPGWRKTSYNIRQLKKISRLTAKAKRSRCKDKEQKIIDAYTKYVELSRELIERIENALNTIDSMAYDFVAIVVTLEINFWLEKAETQISQITRRVFEGCPIPHSEKIFSVFEPHTRWISKGKAGVPVEFGLPVSIFKDQHGLILGYQVMETENDVECAVPLTKKVKELFPALISCSFDKGYWSPDNQENISQIIENPVLPKKGKLSQKDRERQTNSEFIKRRKAHPAVESSINGLEHSGLDRCPDRGIIGFKKYVGLAVLARNLQTLGNIIIEKEKKKARRKKRKIAA